MEKYGVELDNEKVKEAEQKDKDDPTKWRKVCPVCGKIADEGGACPVHGTEPFERK